MISILRSITFFFICATLFQSCISRHGDRYRVEGKLDSRDSGFVYLERTNGEGKFLKTDSCILKNGRFLFEGRVEGPEMASLKFGSRNGKLLFFLENSRIRIIAFSDSLDKPVVSGSASDGEYRDFLGAAGNLEDRLALLGKAYNQAVQDGDHARMTAAESEYSAAEREKFNYVRTWVKQHPRSAVSPYLAWSMVYLLELPELESILKGFDTALNRVVYTRNLKHMAETMKSVEAGNMAPDFTQPDTAGKPLSLSSFRGKYVLVDFWASWCRDCRTENPKMVQIYKTFHKKGLEMLGVSFDTNKENWLKGIHDDHLTWNHISDMKGWKNEAGKLYGIQWVPASFLIDKEGRIIAKNLSGDDLEKKLKEIFIK